MPDFFFRKKLNRRQRYAFAFFIKKASASFASVLAPIAKSGFNNCTYISGKKQPVDFETIYRRERTAGQVYFRGSFRV